MKLLVLCALCLALTTAEEVSTTAAAAAAATTTTTSKPDGAKSEVAKETPHKRGVTGVDTRANQHPALRYALPNQPVAATYVKSIPSVQTSLQHQPLPLQYHQQVSYIPAATSKYQYQPKTPIQVPQLLTPQVVQTNTKLLPSQQYVVEEPKQQQQYLVPQQQIQYQPQHQYLLQQQSAPQQYLQAHQQIPAANYALPPQHQQLQIMMILPPGVTHQQGLAYLGGPQGQQHLAQLFNPEGKAGPTRYVPIANPQQAALFAAAPAQQHSVNPYSAQYAAQPQYIAQPQQYVAQPQQYAAQPQQYVAQPQQYIAQPQVIAQPQFIAQPQQYIAQPQYLPQQAQQGVVYPQQDRLEYPAAQPGVVYSQQLGAAYAAQPSAAGVVYSQQQGHQGGSQQTRSTPSPLADDSAGKLAGNYGLRMQRSQQAKPK